VETTRAALVVAAYEFEDPRFQQLRAPARDVEALAGVLGEAAIGGFDVKTVVNESSPVVQQELERFFSDRKPEDLLLLYFSCHGVKDSTGRLYFATTNTAFDLLRSTGVPASFVSEQMEFTRSKRIVLLLDCCYSGAFVKGFRERGDDSVPLGQLEGRGRAVITASRATEYAFEADELTSENSQPSVFTGAIVEGLSTGAADRDGDGRVTVDELYDYVYDNVRDKVAGQTPGRWVNLEGDLVIARNPRPPVRPAPLSVELARAVESDAALQRLGAVFQLAEWLDHGDPGRQLTAREVLERLSNDYDERVATAASSRLAAAEHLTARSPAAAAPATTRPPAVVPSPVATPAKSPATPATPAATPATTPAAAEPSVTPEPTTTAEPMAKAKRTPDDHGVSGPARADARGHGDQRGRVVAWLVGGGLVAIALGVFLPFLDYGDGTEQLADDNWIQFWLLGLVVLAGYAVLQFVNDGEPSDVGVGIIIGIGPTIVPFAFLSVAEVLEADAESIGVGLVFFLVGSLAMSAASVIVAVGIRRDTKFMPRWTRGSVVLTAAAAVVGVFTAVAWSDVTVRHYVNGLDVSPEHVSSLLLRLLLLTVGVCALWVWLRRTVPRAALLPAIGLLYTAVLVMFVIGAEPDDGAAALFLVVYALLAFTAVVIPVVSTVFRPERRAAVVLATWAVVSISAWLDTAFKDDQQGAGAALNGALLVTVGLALVIATRKPEPAQPA
jgi:hypothetical protein